jgi:hypothetical protein
VSGEPSSRSLAEQQAELVAALVAGGPVPDGVDPARLAAAREALLRKRSGEVAAAWPQLAAAFGAGWHDEFVAWAQGRPPAGAATDGLAFAAWLDAEGRLPGPGRAEYRRAVRAAAPSAREGLRRLRWRRAPR